MPAVDSSAAAATSALREYSDRPMPWQMDKMTDIGTRKIFNEDHDILRESVRKFWQSVPREDVMKWEEQGFVDKEFWKEVGAQGLIGVETPADRGGWGGDFLSNIVGMEEQIYNMVPGLFNLQSDLVMPYIASYGTEEQIEKYQIPLRDGKLIGAIAMTEPGGGSDLQGIRTQAVRDGDDWILNGSKVFISSGWNADVVIVVAITDKNVEKQAYGISLFLVDTNLPGFKRGKLLKKIGMHTQDTAELFFEDMRLPGSAILGGEDGLNRGFQFLMHDLGRERLIIAVAASACMELAYELTREYTKERIAFGKPLTSLQQVRHTLAEVKTDCMFSRVVTDQLIEAYANDDMDQQTVSMAKYWCAEKQIETTMKLQQLFGGYGYMTEYPIANLFAGARVQSIYGGTTEIMKELISRTI